MTQTTQPYESGQSSVYREELINWCIHHSTVFQMFTHTSLIVPQKITDGVELPTLRNGNPLERCLTSLLEKVVNQRSTVAQTPLVQMSIDKANLLETTGELTP